MVGFVSQMRDNLVHFVAHAQFQQTEGRSQNFGTPRGRLLVIRSV
tara:strand:- start:94 stop:228 length:135 start_codon:yes stop_codon:yes gene_type:complete